MNCFLLSIDNQPEDYWFSAPKKGVMVFALPGEPGLTELAGDFKIHFHDGQGDFYWQVPCPLVMTHKIAHKELYTHISLVLSPNG